MGAFVTPLLAALITGAFLTVVPFAQRGWASSFPRGMWIACALAFGLLLWLGGELGFYPAIRISSVVWTRAAGVVLAIAAAALAVVGTRARRRSELWLASPVIPLDDALAELRGGASVRDSVFRGRLGAHEPVTSPGGLVCAMYEAELRSVREDGRDGALLSRERGQAIPLLLAGRDGSCRLDATVNGLCAPVQVLRCGVAPAELEPAAALVDGAGGGEAVSWERVGRIGEECLVSGRLARDLDGRVALTAGAAGPPVVLAGGEDPEQLGRRHRSTARIAFALALACTVAAANLLGSTIVGG